MSWKKKKLGRQKNKILLLVAVAGLIILILSVLLILKVFYKEDYYSIESRLENVENTVVGDDSSFETIGWLRVQGTNLDLPIIYTDDYHLEFPVEEERYVWSMNYDTIFHNQINIMGHNIFNLSANPKISSSSFYRFEELMAFVYYDFAKENKYIQLTLDGEEYIYKIFSVGFIPASEVTSFPLHDDYTSEEMKEHLKLLTENNLYQYDIDVNNKDKIISLITCTRFFGIGSNYDFFVNGRLLRDGEKIKDYKVTKSENYNKIEKVLKGDDSNEEEDSL